MAFSVLFYFLLLSRAHFLIQQPKSFFFFFLTFSGIFIPQLSLPFHCLSKVFLFSRASQEQR